MEDFSSTGQLVTLGLVDSSIGAMAKGLALIDMKASIVKDFLCSNLIGHLIVKCMFPELMCRTTKNCGFTSLSRHTHFYMHPIFKTTNRL